jgi:antitoxin CcdA
MSERQSKNRKKAVNLTIDAGLLAEAKAAGTNLSAVLEKALDDSLRGDRAQAWKAENKDAIEGVNAFIAENGLPLAKFRTW